MNTTPRSITVKVPTGAAELDQVRALMRSFTAWHRHLMRLGTSIRQSKAQALYEGLGFYRIEPYYELPPELHDWLVFMEMPL